VESDDVELVTDTNSKIFFNWLNTEPDKTALEYLDSDEIYGHPLILEKVQTAPNNYAIRFGGKNEKDMFYFRRGVIQFCDRFNAVFRKHGSNEKLYFGHIECIVVKSPHLEYCNETNHNVGWLFAVYCAPEYRGKGLGLEMVRKAVQHLKAHVKCVYLIVFSSNDRAFSCYKKADFHHVRFVGIDDKFRLMRCLLN